MAATGQGGSNGGDGGGQAAEAQQGQGGSVDVGQLAEQFGQMSASQAELGEWLRSEPWRAQESEGEQQEENQELDLSWLDPEAPGFDPDEVAQRLGGLINQTAEQRAQQLKQSEIDPLKNDVAEMRREREAESLVREFPALAEPETASEVVSVAKQLAEANGMPDLANQPWFWRLTYMAGTAAEAANEEGSENPRAAHLEGGGGGVPGGGQVDYAQMIVNGGRGEGGLGAGVLPFS